MIVRTGQHQKGLVEITQGLHASDTIVMDGAGFLTDQALIKVTSNHTAP